MVGAQRGRDDGTNEEPSRSRWPDATGRGAHCREYTFYFWSRLSCVCLQRAERWSRRDHDSYLHLCLHPAETNQQRKHACWGHPRRVAAVDWLGGRARNT